MQPAAIQPSRFSAAATSWSQGAGGAPLTSAQREFASVLGQMDRAERPLPGALGRLTDAAEPLKLEKQARAAAEQFVAVSLVQPLLGQLRTSNAASGVFAPSQGERQFQTMFDAQIAQRIVTASKFGIVDKLTEQLIKRARGTTDAKPKPASPLDLAG